MRSDIARSWPAPLLTPFIRSAYSPCSSEHSAYDHRLLFPASFGASASIPKSHKLQPLQRFRSDEITRKYGDSVPILCAGTAWKQGKRILAKCVPSNNTRVILIACRCGLAGGENAGRFEDNEMGNTLDSALNCKGDWDGRGGGNGSRNVFDGHDSRRVHPLKILEKGLGPHPFLNSEGSLKDKAWPHDSCNHPRAKRGNPLSRSSPSSSLFGVDTKDCQSGISGTDQSLLREKVGKVGTPMSLRMLKHKQGWNGAGRSGNKGKNGCETTLASSSECCSFKKAFSSMVYMIRTLQSYAIHLRQGPFSEDLHAVVGMVQRELHSSFLWLFQQVFACTPKLMLAVMILLANFTVFSIGNDVGVAAMHTAGPPIATVSVVNESGLFGILNAQGVQNGRVDFQRNHDDAGAFTSVSPELTEASGRDCWGCFPTENGDGGSSGRNVAVAGGADRDGQSGNAVHGTTMYSNCDMNVVDAHGLRDSVEEADQMARSLHVLQEAHTQMSTSCEVVSLDRDTKQRLVASVQAKIEPDDYLCFDRTDLDYQYAISMDASNPLLLANYAQFLHVVRHDHDRAEEFFSRAIKADPADGDAMNRFASFLWLARGDRPAADRVYKAAIDSDPSNPFLTGSYASFLWLAGDEDPSCPVNPAT